MVGFQNGTVTIKLILASDELNLLSQTLLSSKCYLEKICHSIGSKILNLSIMDQIFTTHE